LIDDGRSLVVRAGDGWTPETASGPEVAVGTDSDAGFAIVSGEPIIIPDLATERRFRIPDVVRQHGLVSSVSVVVPGQPQPYGVLSVYTRVRREFSGDDVHFLRAVANVIGASIRDRRASHALRESEARFRGIFEQAAVGIAQVGLDGRWLHVNTAICRITGYTAEHLARLRFHDITQRKFHSRGSSRTE